MCVTCLSVAPTSSGAASQAVRHASTSRAAARAAARSFRASQPSAGRAAASAGRAESQEVSVLAGNSLPERLAWQGVAGIYGDHANPVISRRARVSTEKKPQVSL